MLKEKIRVIVIGVGNYLLIISGSIIVFDKVILLIKNIFIIKFFDKEENLEDIYFLGKKKCEMYEDICVVIFIVGFKSFIYGEIKIIVSGIIRLFEEIKGFIIVILENDFVKVLG